MISISNIDYPIPGATTGPILTRVWDPGRVLVSIDDGEGFKDVGISREACLSGW
jgi:hypothetical protein